MANRKNRKAAIKSEAAQTETDAILAAKDEAISSEEAATQNAIEEITSDTLPKSVVPLGYKQEYRARAIAAGRNTKAARRCNGDWLARELEARVLDDDDKLIVSAFESILNENGIKHEAWSRESKGWQGRFRMSGSVALRARAKKDGFVWMGGEKVGPLAEALSVEGEPEAA